MKTAYFRAVFAQSLIRNREIIRSLAKREITSKYQGSLLGRVWLVFYPLCLLSIYTIIFSQVFKTRWPGSGNNASNLVFACNLFAGLITYNFFGEILSKSPRLITGNANYVKKVIFPLEVLSCINVVSAGFSALIGFGILFVATAAAFGEINYYVAYIPIVWAPLVLFSLGSSWIAAALGAYIKDLDQLIGLLLTVLMFMSPIFFPLEALPSSLRWLLQLNPLAWFIETTRAVTITNNAPNISSCLIRFAVALIYAEAGYRWFKILRKGFADVL